MISGVYSINGEQKILQGTVTTDIISSGSGVVTLQESHFGMADDLLRLVGKRGSSLFGETLASRTAYALNRSEELSEVLSGEVLADPSFGASGASDLSKQLAQVAKLINARAKIGMERAGFFVQVCVGSQ